MSDLSNDLLGEFDLDELGAPAGDKCACKTVAVTSILHNAQFDAGAAAVPDLCGDRAAVAALTADYPDCDGATLAAFEELAHLTVEEVEDILAEVRRAPCTDDDDFEIVCPTCDGTGNLETQTGVADFQTSPCDACNGTGVIEE